jgi:hypothetical protein
MTLLHPCWNISHVALRAPPAGHSESYFSAYKQFKGNEEWLTFRVTSADFSSLFKLCWTEGIRTRLSQG